MNVIRRSFIILLFLIVAPAHAEWYSDVQDKMGTRVEVRLWHDDEAVAKHLLVESMAEFDRIEAGMSTYRPDSELSRINAAAADGWVDVSTELFDLIRRALELSQTTGGAFDVTYDSVGTLYNYRERVRPAEQDIEAQLESIDYRHVQLDPDRSKIRYSRPGVRINLGGIAKGYSVESVIDRLRRAGITNALVSAGGDTRLLGDRGGQPWIVGVRDPDDENGFVTRLGLEDEAVSTSGDYERFFIEDGVRYHHILNPSTGKSAGAVRSATVIGGDATLTDGLSTSVFVLGPEAGLELIEGLPGYEALIIDKSHQVHFSSGLDPR
jgi:thiamine biosynthesis lipoprotein